MAFSRVSSGDSVIPSSCEMKDEPEFKPLQGKPAFFWVSASPRPFHFRQKTQSPSHIPISVLRLLLRCLWKVGLRLQSKTGNHSHPEMIWGARNIPQTALLKLMILYTWDSCLRESLEFPKWSQATCSVWCGSRGGYGANARETGLISIWFWVHWAILHSWGDISALLLLWQCSWGFSLVPSQKSMFLTSWICNRELLSMQYRGIRPLLAVRGMSHEFSGVAAGIWCIFSSYGENGHLKLRFVPRSQDSCLVITDTSGN